MALSKRKAEAIAKNTYKQKNTLLSLWGVQAGKDTNKKKQKQGEDEKKSPTEEKVSKHDNGQTDSIQNKKNVSASDIRSKKSKLKAKSMTSLNKKKKIESTQTECFKKAPKTETDAQIKNNNSLREKKETNEKIETKNEENLNETFQKKETTIKIEKDKLKSTKVKTKDMKNDKKKSKKEMLISMYLDQKSKDEQEKNDDIILKDLKQSKDESSETSTVVTQDSTEVTSKKKESSNTTKHEDISNIYYTDSKSSMPYPSLCETFEKIESISGRLEIQDILTTLYRQALVYNPQDMYNLLYLTSNTVAPAYDCVELGVGDAVLIKALCEAGGSSVNAIKAKVEKEGDLGNVAVSVKGKQKTLGFGIKPRKLNVKEVLDTFRQIAKTTGQKAQKWKVDKIKGLLVRAQSGIEAKYIIRALQGRLRIGLSESTVLISLAHALLHSPPIKAKEHECVSEPEEAVIIIKKAYAQVPSYDFLLQAALSVPLQEIPSKCTLQPGLPVAPMLAKPEKSIISVLKRLNGLLFTCEYKYDGERAQVHMNEGGETKVFSRNLLDTTEKFMEVPGYVKEACENVTSFVLDTEVVAWNRETKQFVPFQVLSTRAKKIDSENLSSNSAPEKVTIIVQAFDLMYLNGRSLLDQPFLERRELLHEHFKPIEGKFQFATSIDHKENGDTIPIEEFLDKAVKGQCEGLMIKTLEENATYEPSKRSLNWLKLKKDYLEGLGDSVDLVVLGGYHGRGKRAGVYGAYLLACYDQETEEYQSVCKIGTGFSEEDLKNLAESLNKHKIETKSSQFNVSDSLACDVWFDAVQVWEIKAADLSKSSVHKGALNRVGEAGRGIGLRFPRFERVRTDKKPEESTTSDQILEMYYNQDSVGNTGADDMDEL